MARNDQNANASSPAVYTYLAKLPNVRDCAEGSSSLGKDKRHTSFTDKPQKRSTLTQAALNRANSIAPTAGGKNLVKWAAAEASSATPQHAPGAVQKRASRESILSDSSHSSANTGNTMNEYLYHGLSSFWSVFGH